MNPSPSFPALDDLMAQFRDLVREHPDQVHLFIYGRSRQGEDLRALRLGDGPLRVLAYGFPQPDEPLGGVVLLRLAQQLLDDVGLRQRATWTLLPCVDPDGARLNEGWFTASLDLQSYAWRHFRPPEGEQVEWSFPSSDPIWPWDRLRPETRALKALLDAVQPQLLFPLHNALLGGAYAFLSAEAAELAPLLASIWEVRGLPTHRGEPELPFAPVLGPGVYRLPYLGEIVEALRSNGVEDPAGLLGCGAPAYLYVRRYGSVYTVVPELPLFVVAGVDDVRPGGDSRRHVLQQVLRRDRAALAVWSELYERAGPLLGQENVYRAALESYQRSTPVLLESTARWLATDSSLRQEATVAEVVDNHAIAPYMALLPLGDLAQALRFESGRGGPSSEARLLAEQVGELLRRDLAAALSGLEARAIPPDVLVEIVLAMVGPALELVQGAI